MQYTNIQTLIRALESGKVGGVIIWRGASAIDGSPIVLVANRFADDSHNEKTGAMVQTWILPDPIAHGIEVNGNRPAKIMAWLKSTGAVSICGDCPHAWQYNAATGEHEKGACYVAEFRAPAAVLGGIARGAYPIAGVDFPAEWIPALGAGRAVRAGSYGDPAACPPAVWRAFLGFARTRTGYTHGWKSAHAQFRANAMELTEYVMASCDSAADYDAARAFGFRCFYVVPSGTIAPEKSALSVGAHVAGAMVCPASDEFEKAYGRKTDCARCGACSGAGGKAAKFPHVIIGAHGAGKKRVTGDCPAAARMVSAMGV